MIERIGIMGGMFDPVHVGHIQVALAAQELLQLDQVRLVPCGIPNHRDLALCSSLQRLDMLELAIRDYPRLVVDDRELNRAGTSYSYDTLYSLRQEYSQAGLYFILGADAFASLDKWHRWQELFELSHFIVIERPGYPIEVNEELQQQLRNRLVAVPDALWQAQYGHIYIMRGLANPVSSSQVRRRIANNESLDELLDPAVAAYLKHHELYKNAVTND